MDLENPLEELKTQGEWKLQRWGFHSVLAKKQSLSPSFLKCPFCSQKTFTSGESEEHFGTNISGFACYETEIFCEVCGQYALYRSTDSFGPTG